MHFSLWSAGRQFILTIRYPRMWLVIQVVYFRSCPDCLTVASYKGRSNYDTDSNHPVFMFTYSAKAEFCFKKKIDQKKKRKRKLGKRTVPQAFMREKAAATLFKYLSWKVNPKGHWQGHWECEIVQFWWTLTLLKIVRRETLYIHSPEFFPNWKPLPRMALNI